MQTFHRAIKMNEYTVVNGGRTYFIPKWAVDSLIPDFVAGLENYIEKQRPAPAHRQQSAFYVLDKFGIECADEWLATLIAAPFFSYEDGLGSRGETGIGAFVKYYSKVWGLYNHKAPRDSFEAVFRIIRIFFNSCKLVTKQTRRIRYTKAQVNFTLTPLGKRIYPSFEIEMADETHVKEIASFDAPKEYMSTPWLSSVGSEHPDAQDEEVSGRLTRQACAASAVGFVVPSKNAQVYTDWFPMAHVSKKVNKSVMSFLESKEYDKIVNVRILQKRRLEHLQEVKDELRYYPVGFDKKARQYMMGYPLNPQGAKVDRPLFTVLAVPAPIAKVIADLEMLGQDAFGAAWAEASKMKTSQLENHNSDEVKEMCTTKGLLDLQKYTILVEYAANKEKNNV